MKKEDWVKLKEKLIKLHPLERLKKCKELLAEEKDEETIEELAQLIAETKKSLGIEEITETGGSMGISTRPVFSRSESIQNKDAIDDRVEKDVATVVEETTDSSVKYSDSKTENYSVAQQTNPAQKADINSIYHNANRLKEILRGGRMFNKEEKEEYEDLRSKLISRLPDFQMSSDLNQSVKETLLKTEYILKDIERYTSKKQSNTTFW